MPSYIHLFDIAVCPLKKLYKEDFHGVPIKILEYMVAQCPVIATQMPNLVRTFGNTPIYVPQGDADGWSDAFERLYSDRVLRQVLGENARRFVIEKNMTWQGNADRIYEFCLELMNVSPRAV